MEQITTVGIDLAKRVFALHGVDAAGRVVLRRTVRREQLVELIAGLSPCLIGMEAHGTPATYALHNVTCRTHPAYLRLRDCFPQGRRSP